MPVRLGMKTDKTIKRNVHLNASNVINKESIWDYRNVAKQALQKIEEKVDQLNQHEESLKWEETKETRKKERRRQLKTDNRDSDQ